MSTSTSTSEVTRSAPEMGPEDVSRRERHMAQLAEARKKAVAKNRETRKRKEQRMQELEEKVSKIDSVERERDMRESIDQSEPIVVTKRARREERVEAPKNFASGISMDLLRGVAAGGLSLLSLYLSNRMRQSVATPSVPVPVQQPPPQPRAPAAVPLPPPEPPITRGPPRNLGASFVAPVTGGVHKSGFVAA
jgi:hypothetical protein